MLAYDFFETEYGRVAAMLEVESQGIGAIPVRDNYGKTGKEYYSVGRRRSRSASRTRTDATLAIPVARAAARALLGERQMRGAPELVPAALAAEHEWHQLAELDDREADRHRGDRTDDRDRGPYHGASMRAIEAPC